MLQGLLNYLQKRVDVTTNGFAIITTDHKAVHDKEAFSISGVFASVANGATVNYAFKTPASGKTIHYKFSEFWASNNKVRSDFYEAPTNAPINGTDLTAINHYREGTLVSSAMQAIKSSMDINLTGATNLETVLFGYGSAPKTLDMEFWLNPDTWYIRTFTNSTGGAIDLSFYEFWYEED